MRSTPRNLQKLFVINVFSKHGVPMHITCDCGSEFVSAFFCSLGQALDMKIHFTSGYHPEGDGQTECLNNQTLEQYLWIFCNYQQDNQTPNQLWGMVKEEIYSHNTFSEIQPKLQHTITLPQWLAQLVIM